MADLTPILALATDYDGTLAEDDAAPASTIAALARFKASGRKLILVTGRHLPDLQQVFGSLHLFDAIVAENGGLLYFPATGEIRPLAVATPDRLVERLRACGVDELAVGQTIVATHARHHETVGRVLAELALDHKIILNTDALMVLPKGTDKSSGLQAALAALALDPASVAAIGDAENDVVFLKYSGYAVAVANALPEVKAVAHLVTAGSRGAGVEEFIASILEPEAPASAGSPRHTP